MTRGLGHGDAGQLDRIDQGGLVARLFGVNETRPALLPSALRGSQGYAKTTLLKMKYAKHGIIK